MELREGVEDEHLHHADYKLSALSGRNAGRMTEMYFVFVFGLSPTKAKAPNGFGPHI